MLRDRGGGRLGRLCPPDTRGLRCGDGSGGDGSGGDGGDRCCRGSGSGRLCRERDGLAGDGRRLGLWLEQVSHRARAGSCGCRRGSRGRGRRAVCGGRRSSRDRNRRRLGLDGRRDHPPCRRCPTVSPPATAVSSPATTVSAVSAASATTSATPEIPAVSPTASSKPIPLVLVASLLPLLLVPLLLELHLVLFGQDGLEWTCRIGDRVRAGERLSD